MIRKPHAQALLGLVCLGVSFSNALAGAQGEGAGSVLWWSLTPVVRPALPEESESNPIDQFINAELRNRGVKAVPAADPLALLRRVWLGLIGIPPSPVEQEAFLADRSPDAYEKVVDRLLADERHWLDVLRYADADERITAAPGIYFWGDWVINALHDDAPYDQFVQVRLTGQRAQERTQMSATGYRLRRESRPGDQFALGCLARGAGEDPQDLAISAVDTVSTDFMGMMVGCAKCHNHMFDPISQKDYYAMKALFDPFALRKVTLASAAELLASGTAMAEAEKRRAALEQKLNDFIAPYKAKLYEERLFKGGVVHGATDEVGYKAVDSPHFYSDLHATILHQLGLNHKKMEVEALGRTFKLVEKGAPIQEVIA